MQGPSESEGLGTRHFPRAPRGQGRQKGVAQSRPGSATATLPLISPGPETLGRGPTWS